MFTTDQKGALAELKIMAAAAELGIGVYKAMSDGERYDLVFYLRPRLVRVQCKWAARKGGVMAIRCYSCRRTRTGMIKLPYGPDEIDALAAYCADTDRCYFIPLERMCGRTSIQLRLAPTVNNQAHGISWAREFEFAATLGRLVGP